MYKNVKKKIERGVAFPICISVNNTVCHFSPLANDETVLEEGDVLKIDMGCQIDGFIAVVAHTHVLQQGPVTGRAADSLTRSVELQKTPRQSQSQTQTTTGPLRAGRVNRRRLTALKRESRSRAAADRT
ncbi:unnamed protein product [Fraxinus pennsylvanica]|uniref:Peptidase M24 domain-containing protein n=1 Tax=Fraxinus pennsylvanica TaxID=56036 RepID=A0AAD2ECZ2_9LAMI|nr:unnamed protein product [Fraxinus pennsylvanica]